MVAHIYWKLIGYHKLTNEIFNNSISKSIDRGTAYFDYNKHILEACTNIATISNQTDKGCFHFSRDYFLPLIKERETVISDYRTLGIGKGDSSETKIRLKIAQVAVDDSIALSKAAWSAHRA